jgi:hypothetical protein
MCELLCQQAIAAVIVDPITSLTLVLAALGALLTALAIIIGIAAIFGYSGIKEEARRIATDAAHKKLTEYFENAALKDKIRGMVVATTLPSSTAPIEAHPRETERIYEEGGEGDDRDNTSEGE